MIEILKENIGFIRQIFRLSRSELIKTYKGAALGPVWAIVKPAVTIFVYWFAFDIGLRSGGGVTYNDIERPFFLFLIVGILPWFFMKDAILNGASCFRSNRQYITKMPFPVATIPTYQLLSDLYVHAGLTVIIYLIVITSGVPPSIYNIQILFYMPMMYMFFLTLSWFTAPLSAVSKDFLNIIHSLITALFWMSGILWDAHGLENEVLRRIILASPTTYFANGYRNALLYNKWFFETGYETICFFGWFILFAVVGSYMYKRLRRIIPDVL